MFKKTMTFDDLEGNEVQQTFYFNYNKKEIAELIEFGRVLRFPARPGVNYLPLEQQMDKLTTDTDTSGLSNQENNEQAYEIFQNLLLDAYGRKGDDNVSFDKSPELRHYWSTHVAFPELVFEFLDNPRLAADFIEKCLPPRMVAQAKKEISEEHRGKISDGTLSEMVAEAARRQEDPATRIEPGVIQEGESAQIIQMAKQVADDGGGVKAKPLEELTETDIVEMDDIAFAKLDPQKLSREAMLAAFRRKTQS